MSNTFVSVSNTVDKTKIRTEIASNGDEIIIIPSYTLPDDVVMNGGLYPASEIEKSYKSLEGTPAPLGHPVDDNGEFLSANSEVGVHNFQCGVFNGKVKREGSRIYVEKRLNKTVAETTERGRRVLERVNQFMNGEDDPLHTSTGIFLNVEELNEPQIATNGKKYSWIARNMQFDHDCILLDDPGAATPADGVGMMVNKQRQLHVNLATDLQDDEEVKGLFNKFMSFLANGGKTSYNKNQQDQGGHVNESIKEGEDMSFRQSFIDKLKANKVELDYDNATDEQLLDAVNSIKTEQTATDTVANELLESIKETLDGLASRVDTVETKANESVEAKKNELAKTLGIEAEEAATMSVNTLQSLADKLNTGDAYHTGSGFQTNSDGEDLTGTIPNLEVK